MEPVFENRRLGPAFVHYRADYTATQWFGDLKLSFNTNRPVEYRVEDHAIVGDGWQEVLIGGMLTKQYHMNYGWPGSGDDIWYDLDDLLYGGIDEEYMVYCMEPDVSMGNQITGLFPAEWIGGNYFDKPTRYFNRDLTLVGATFEAGQGLQYLRPGFWMQAWEVWTNEFMGAPGAVTKFYHKAPFGDVRIRILDGSLKLIDGGEIVFH